MKISGVQIGRFIAALLVLLYHFSWNAARDKYFGSSAEELRVMFSFGGVAGVAFFFVLSGALMYMVHAHDFGDPSKVKNFLERRFIRIYPTYWIILCVVAGLAFMSAQTRQAIPADIGSIIKAFLLIPDFNGDGARTEPPLLSVAWTLQFEVFFYLAFAISIVGRRFQLILFGIFLTFFLLNVFGFSSWAWLSLLGSPIIFLFLLGILAGFLAEKLKAFRLKNGLISALLIICGLTTAFGIRSVADFWAWQFWTFYGAISFFLIILLFLQPKSDAASAKAKFFDLLGGSSYSLYLIHLPVVSIACKLYFIAGLVPSIVGASVLMAICVVACSLLSLAFFRFVETPLLRRLSGNFQSIRK